MKENIKAMSKNRKQVKAAREGISSLKKNSLSNRKEKEKKKSVLKDTVSLKKPAAGTLNSGEAERYHDFLENIQDGCFELDLSGNVTFFNNSICRILGYSAKELMGMNYRRYTDEETAKKAVKAYNKVYKTGKPIKKFSWQVVRKDNAKIYIEGSISLRKDSSGNPIGFVGIVNDITERKQAEKVIRESKIRFKSQYHGSPIPTFTWQKIGGDFILVECNKAALAVTGENIKKFINKTAHNIYRDQQDVLRDIQRCFEEKAVIKRELLSGHFMPGRNIIATYAFVPDNLVMVHVEDITERKRTEEKLQESEEKYRSILENIQEAYFEVDLAGNFTFFNNSLCRLTGSSRQELAGTNYSDFSDKETSAKVFKAFNKIYKTGESNDALDWLIIRKDGTKRYIESSVSLKKDLSGKPTGFKGVIRDITERKYIEQKLEKMATHDALTGLPNRLLFSQLLNHAIQAARRYQRQFAVFFIDLDRFKIINDTMGHEAGDQLLQEIADRFRQSLRAVDVVGRLGGDEFIILIEEVTELNQVATLAKKILTSTMKPVMILGQECRVTASIGISIFPINGEDDQTLMKNADIAMYFAKEEGKNNYQFYSKDIKTQSTERMSIETNLRFALERKEFFLDYQARLDFKTGMITGVEAFLRWENPYLGSVTPTQFIPVADETGLIVSIGKWVLKTVCAQHAIWQSQGLPPVCISVNLSLRQLMDDNLVEDIKTILKESGMAPNLLELEISESMLMHNPAYMIKVLTSIKEMGVRLAVDNFGTGYSSLTQISHFPIDTLKVDRSFVRNITRDSDDKAIIESIINMGKHLSLTVVAEGVETQIQDDFLRQLICDEMQGYYFSKPVAPDQFADLLRTHNSSSRK